jgi:hypothetical protein
LPQEVDGAVPQLASLRMMRQALDVFRQAVGVEALDGIDDPCMEHPAPLAQQ